jgi:hypothetical protein
MSYFPDLSLYAYAQGMGNDIEGGGLDLNVGWLSAEHEFVRGQVPGGFVAALLVCATRPAREYRGLHSCELCDVETARKDLDGREVLLGNGEIRVVGSDERWYTAPTLVAHYVEDHEYLPPAAFIDGVFARSKTIYVVRGKQLQRFRSLGLQERLATCLEALSALAAHQRTTVDTLIPKIQETAAGDPERDVWRNSWKATVPAELSELDTVVRHACFTITAGFSRQFRTDDHERDHRTIWSMVRLLEDAADAGLDVTVF